MGRRIAGMRRRSAAITLSWRPVVAVFAVVSGCYYGLALVAALKRRTRHVRGGGWCPPVSILKPVYGWDDRLGKAIESHARQDYPEFELLLGIRDNDERPIQEVRRSQRSFPNCDIRVVCVTTDMPNGKVGALADLVSAAKHSVLVINDADICVEPDYLRRVSEPLQDDGIGLVTALYRAKGSSFPARFEALGVASEFAPSVLVARLLGVAEFALGSTMALRSRELRRIGGFHAIGDYLADDYQLGASITRLGLSVALADTVVETTLGAGDWAEVWKHQVRWSRTIRVSRPMGYYGYVVTQATVWACLAALAGYWWLAIAVLALRMSAGAAAAIVLKDWEATASCWMIPFRDLFGFAVWVAGAGGTTVEWRGLRLRLRRDGRIQQSGGPPVSR